MKQILVPSGREHRQKIAALLVGQRVSGAFVEVRDQNLRHDAAVGRVGDAPAVGRPVRVDVQPLARRHAQLVRAVVVADVDVLAVPVLFHRIGEAFVITIGDERQFRARDAAKAPLVVNVVRHPVGAGSRVLQRDPVVELSERHLARAHVEQPHLHPERVPVPLHRADDHAVGAELAPAIEGNVGGRLRLRNRAIRVARNQIELALEGEVVPQHFTEHLGGGDRFGVRRQRDEIGHGVVQRRADVAGDRQVDIRLAGRRRRWWRAFAHPADARGARCRRPRKIGAGLMGCVPALFFAGNRTSRERSNDRLEMPRAAAAASP